MKIYDLANSNTEPERFQVADSVRFASYFQNDNLILSTYVDKPNIRYLLVRMLHVQQQNIFWIYALCLL